jgi:hypothetical protein
MFDARWIWRMTINPKSVDEQIEMVYTLAFGQQVNRYRPGNGVTL